MWVAGAASRLAADLAAIPPGDWDGFGRTAAARRGLSQAFPELADSTTKLFDAERAWAAGTAKAAVARLDPQNTVPRDVRETCREVEKRLLALPALEDTRGHFREARQALFRAAHDAAQREARAHLDAGRYDLAFGVARVHAVEWFATTELLGPTAQQEVAGLRDGYRYLAVLADKAGPAPEAAPAPRTKP